MSSTSTMNFKEFLAHSDLEYKDYQEEGVDWCIRKRKLIQNMVQEELLQMKWV